MATQDSFILLTFLLEFSLLQFPSLGLYNPQDTYFINCGSDTDVTQNNNLYIGESHPTHPTKIFTKTSIKTNQSSVSSPLYQTARVFYSENSYEFPAIPNNTYMLRFHFLSFSSPTDASTANFNVSVPGFSVLQNFDAKNTVYSPLIKEYFVKIVRKRFKITFTPQTSSFAFVNAIELFMLPIHFIPDSVARFNYYTVQGLSTYSGGLLSQALETTHRLNVGGRTVIRSADNLSRDWLPDDSYITTPQNAKNSSFSGDIKRTANDESDGPNSNQYIAPDLIYQTARATKNGTNGLNISWNLPVDKNRDHFLRLHFCDLSSIQPGLTTFYLYIYDNYVQNVNDGVGWSFELNDPYYYDYVVRSDSSGILKVTVTPNATDFKPDAFLNGLELMKMIESSGLVPLDDLDSKSKASLPVLVGSVVGGIVLVSVVVVVFLWIRKIRKQKLLESSDMLAISALSSPLPNINLGQKISLLDLQFATENFDAERIIGKGGFGNVYKGVLKNRITVAVKRSVSGSGQGLHEFETEIMVLSKIRHIHLVSLIGYCDESGEMILVYEYMEKGTLRDSLYNTNLSSFLTWNQRLEICIGAARGLHYLHKGVVGGIIHRDVKSTNILLDENLVAKLADFGLSKTGPIDQQSYVSTGVKGTFGYLDPDYFRSEKLTEKSDVYSFGVVLLEVLCARPVVDMSCPRGQVNLVEWGLRCKDKGKLEEIVDPSLKEQINQNSLRVFSEIVEKCLQEDGYDRPTMRDVLWDLEYALQLQREPHEDSFSSALTSLEFSNVQRLPSLSTLIEVDDMSSGKVDESESAASMMLDNVSCEANQGTTINSQVSPLE